MFTGIKRNPKQLDASNVSSFILKVHLIDKISSFFFYSTHFQIFNFHVYKNVQQAIWVSAKKEKEEEKILGGILKTYKLPLLMYLKRIFDKRHHIVSRNSLVFFSFDSLRFSSACNMHLFLLLLICMSGYFFFSNFSLSPFFLFLLCKGSCLLSTNEGIMLFRWKGRRKKKHTKIA